MLLILSNSLRWLYALGVYCNWRELLYDVIEFFGIKGLLRERVLHDSLNKIIEDLNQTNPLTLKITARCRNHAAFVFSIIHGRTLGR